MNFAYGCSGNHDFCPSGRFYTPIPLLLCFGSAPIRCTAHPARRSAAGSAAVKNKNHGTSRIFLENLAVYAPSVMSEEFLDVLSPNVCHTKSIQSDDMMICLADAPETCQHVVNLGGTWF